jgi:hypothetical protein
MKRDTKENGKMIYSMAKVKGFVLVKKFMKARSMEKDFIFGKTAQAMMEIGMKTE